MTANSKGRLELAMARTTEERLGAFHLTHRAYVEAGLGQPATSQLRVTKFQLQPESRIFVSKLRQEIVATVSLIPDSKLGLPMEAIYPEEIAALRDRGFWIAEVGCLADRRKDARRFVHNFCNLTRLMAQYAHSRSIDGFVIAVHPRHAKFYKSCLCFEEIGGVVDYPMVSNRPAVALFLRFESARHSSPKKYELFFGDPVPPEQFEFGEMSEAEIDFFRRISVEGSSVPIGLMSEDSVLQSEAMS